jgi:hypothetical protein
MGKEYLELILKEMKEKRTFYTYSGGIPKGITGIRRISTRNYDYTEITFDKLNKQLIFELSESLGLEYEKKRRTYDLRCEHCSIKHGCIGEDGEPSSAYTILKPRRFWFPDLVMDVVPNSNSMRIYDTNLGVDMGSRIIDRYLRMTESASE